MSHSEVNVDNTTDLNIIQKSEEKFKLNKNSELINDDDYLLSELENDEIPGYIREARLNELKLRAREFQITQASTNEIYKELNEDEFLNLTTKAKMCVVHFYHSDFRRCDIMHSHLQKLAQKYSDCKFVKINVEKAKFFVKKLSIQMLPAVLCFVDGILKHRIIGFDQLGNSDNFPTKKLEKILWRLKFIKKREDEEESDENEEDDGKIKHSIFSKYNKESDDSD